MSLGELIEFLERQPADKVLSVGFANPHSYRGNYHELAFEPKRDVAVREMLRDARAAVGELFEGYKGGSFAMDEYTSVFLAMHGCCGEELGRMLLGFMLENDGLIFLTIE